MYKEEKLFLADVIRVARKSTHLRAYASIEIRIILVALIAGEPGLVTPSALLRLPIYVAFITHASESRENIFLRA